MARNASTTGFDFNSSLSPSERIGAAKFFTPSGATGPTLWEKSGNLPFSVEDTFGPNAPDIGAAIGLDSSQFLGGVGGGPSWTFITAPQNVSWSTTNNASRVDIFGTNNPPVVAGSRGMRDLDLSDSLVEGFVRGKNVEAKISSLEALLNYNLNPTDGFVSVPVYQVWANNKSYGGDKGYFIITSVKVNETMRDLQGQTTRAKVDVSLMQVPEYQVNTGRDQAGQVTAGNVAISPEQRAAAAANAQANQNVTGKGGANPASAAAKPASGANSAPSGTTEVNKNKGPRGTGAFNLDTNLTDG
jgi:hypothetical protein